MIKIENVKIAGWEHAIRGMRNPMNSWNKSDSLFDIHENILHMTDKNVIGFDILNEQHFVSLDYFPDDWYLNHLAEDYYIGPNDLDLMKRLIAGGPVHCKFRRMITVWCDITAPLY